jgi:hypothetical protein
MGGEPKNSPPLAYSDIIDLKGKVLTMSDSNIISDSATDAKPVAKKSVAKKTTATKKVAEQAPVVAESVNIEEATVSNDDGQQVITGPKKPRPPRKSNTRSNDDGVVSSNAADAALRKKVEVEVEEPKKQEEKKVALWSARNLRWTGVGSLTTGYNIVKEEAVEKWLSRQGVRKASPEEVATYYGK